MTLDEIICAVMIGVAVVAFVTLYWIGPAVTQYDQDNQKPERKQKC